MATSVGFASSTNQSKAAQAKKSRKAAAVPTTPDIKQTVAKIRANNHGGKPVKEIRVDHDLLRESWQAIIAVMKECKRPYPTTAPAPVAPVVKAPVVFEEIVATYDDPGAIATVKQAVEVFDPEPDPEALPHPLPMAVMDVLPLQLPAECERRIAAVNVLPTLDYAIELLPSFTDYWADRARIRQRIIWEKVDCGEWQADDFCPHRPRHIVAADEPLDSRPRGLSYASAYSPMMSMKR